MGRKRNQGKARKAAKAKADNEEGLQKLQRSGLSHAKMLEDGTVHICLHGAGPFCYKGICHEFETAFREEFYDAADRIGDSVSGCLMLAKNATMDEFAEVWNDCAQMEIAISCFLSEGAQHILEGEYDHAREKAVFTRYLEQIVAIDLRKTQAMMNYPKINQLWRIDTMLDTMRGDVHTLVKFFRKRIPCKCLDEKYEEVKSITKMGRCYNPECPIPCGYVERSKTFYCSRCRNETYCSRECQKACWTEHKQYCDKRAAIIAEFEAEQQHDALALQQS
eukprot:scaffold3941_cov78-Skeletonema_dohrnii-CCMP3373.AAC.2